MSVFLMPYASYFSFYFLVILIAGINVVVLSGNCGTLACFSATCSLLIGVRGFFVTQGNFIKNHLDDLLLLLWRMLRCSYWHFIKTSCFLL